MTGSVITCEVCKTKVPRKGTRQFVRRGVKITLCPKCQTSPKNIRSVSAIMYCKKRRLHGNDSSLSL